LNSRGTENDYWLVNVNGRECGLLYPKSVNFVCTIESVLLMERSCFGTLAIRIKIRGRKSI
jgi:hypothetical protein